MADLKAVHTRKATDEDDVLLEMEGKNGNISDKPIGLYFDSGGHKIDYVLVYERCPEDEEKDDEDAKKAEEHEEKREAFEKALEEEGLLIERDERISAQPREKPTRMQRLRNNVSLGKDKKNYNSTEKKAEHEEHRQQPDTPKNNEADKPFEINVEPMNSDKDCKNNEADKPLEVNVEPMNSDKDFKNNEVDKPFEVNVEPMNSDKDFKINEADRPLEVNVEPMNSDKDCEINEADRPLEINVEPMNSDKDCREEEDVQPEDVKTDTCNNDIEKQAEVPLEEIKTDASSQDITNTAVDKKRAFEDDDNKEVHRTFVKLHIPWKTLSQKGEQIMLKAPLMESDIRVKSWGERVLGERIMNGIRRLNPLTIKDSVITEKPNYFMAYYKQRKHDKYLGSNDNEKMFSTLDRQYAVQRICYTTRFGEGPKGVGLKQLIYDGAYVAAYSLHDGDDDVKDGRLPDNDRQRLKMEWSPLKKMFKYQPYDTIKDYFGTAIALYFAWLGFYTAMLVPLSIVGLLVFIYGIGSAGTSPPVMDSCDKSLKGYFYMCNLCDRQCSYWDLVSTSCAYAYVTHFFDNDGTVFLAIFTSVWATLFLEFWKRRQAVLANHWHVANFEEEEEQIRPEFAATAPTLKKNPVTGLMEPHIPKRTLYQRYGAIGSIIALMIFLVIAAVVGVVVYRGAVFAALSADKNLTIRKNSRIITSCTAAIINLICINLLKFIYIRLAVWLTNWENPRTTTDFEDSFIYKMYLFQFVNTYASIFYIAFFKSDLVVGTPGRYKRIAGGVRLDGCSEQGCFLELCIQLLIIMVGQQIIGNITEVAIPALKTWWKERKEPKNKQLPQYEQDFNLGALEDHYMFWEYLEIVLQYGFVTMFVAAFPLAPVFSLLNSVFEIRVDAINFVTQFRRPDTVIAEDIGAWTRILDILTRISVLVNAFILAFTSEFIPKLVYKNMHDGTLNGYLNSSLSSINVSYFEAGTEPSDKYQNGLNYTRPICRYKGYYESERPFGPTKTYWHVIAARLAFVFVFQYTVYAITAFIANVIPDKPASLDLRMRREEHITKKMLYGRGNKNSGRGADVDSGHSGML